MDFDWDPEKAASNFRKHDITFGQAMKAFHDVHGIEVFDDSGLPDEERTSLIAMAEGKLLNVIYTERPPVKRLISARRATRHEQDIYFRENQS
jgi:uncharacterized protein